MVGVVFYVVGEVFLGVDCFVGVGNYLHIVSNFVDWVAVVLFFEIQV